MYLSEYRNGLETAIEANWLRYSEALGIVRVSVADLSDIHRDEDGYEYVEVTVVCRDDVMEGDPDPQLFSATRREISDLTESIEGEWSSTDYYGVKVTFVSESDLCGEDGVTREPS